MRTTEEKLEGMKLGAGCVFVLVWMVVGPMVSGYVLASLWAWFVVPLGHRNGVDLAPLTVPLAIGIAGTVAFVTHQSETAKQETKSVGELIGMAIARPLFAYLFGWIVQRWV